MQGPRKQRPREFEQEDHIPIDILFSFIESSNRSNARQSGPELLENRTLCVTLQTLDLSSSIEILNRNIGGDGHQRKRKQHHEWGHDEASNHDTNQLQALVEEEPETASYSGVEDIEIRGKAIEDSANRYSI